MRRHASNKSYSYASCVGPRRFSESGGLATCSCRALPLLLLLLGPTHLHAEWLVFEGISVDESGRQHYLDATVAYKRAVLNCIHYLAKFGLTKEQVCID